MNFLTNIKRLYHDYKSKCIIFGMQNYHYPHGNCKSQEKYLDNVALESGSDETLRLLESHSLHKAFLF